MRRGHLILLLLSVRGPASRRGWVKSLREAGFKVESVVEVPSDANGRPPLTRRHVEVLREMALGFSTKEIAGQLGIAVKTVEAHRQELMRRLKIRHIPGLVRHALRTGVLPASWMME